MVQNKKAFEVEGKKYAALRPTHEVEREAQYVYCRSFKDAVENGVMLKDEVDKFLRERKLWDDERQGRFEKLQKSLLENTLALKGGNIKKSLAKDKALQMRRDRWELQVLIADKNKYEALTAEALAEDASFRYKVAACTVYEDSGEKYFKGYEDYLSRQDDPVTIPASNALGSLIFNLDDDFRKKLPENEFLLKYGFCNDKLHLVDKDGNLVDSRGRKVSPNGFLLNDNGDPVDEEGRILTADGEYKSEFVEFLDD